jgi:hypothetical protein
MTAFSTSSAPTSSALILSKTSATLFEASLKRARIISSAVARSRPFSVEPGMYGMKESPQGILATGISKGDVACSKEPPPTRSSDSARISTAYFATIRRVCG